jgi:putative transcriptional regulator
MTEAKEFHNLTGKVLIASPYTMQGNVFHKSVIYVVHHGPEGSVGLIVNYPVNSMPIESLFKKIEINIDLSELNLEVNLGGPVDIERGFFLHTSEYDKNLLFKPKDNEGLAVSSNVEILKDIASGLGPKNAMFFVGYTGWNAGQMEFEIENNLWIISEPDQDLIFSPDLAHKWNHALDRLGISNAYFSPNSASC